MKKNITRTNICMLFVFLTSFFHLSWKLWNILSVFQESSYHCTTGHEFLRHKTLMLHCPEEWKGITVPYWENLLPHWTQSRCTQRMRVISHSVKRLLCCTVLVGSDPSVLAWSQLHHTHWLHWFNHSWFCRQPGPTGLDTHLSSEIPLIEESMEA